MPHFKCVTCRTRLHTQDPLLDELCPGCGSAFERAGDLAELVGYRAISSAARESGGSGTHQPLAAEAVALPRPDTIC